ncbi:MAG: hypothetical protein ACPH89_09605, partial [Candidatus Puniceispirillaceae bacterium]
MAFMPPTSGNHHASDNYSVGMEENGRMRNQFRDIRLLPPPSQMLVPDEKGVIQHLCRKPC